MAAVEGFPGLERTKSPRPARICNNIWGKMGWVECVASGFILYRMYRTLGCMGGGRGGEFFPLPTPGRDRQANVRHDASLGITGYAHHSVSHVLV